MGKISATEADRLFTVELTRTDAAGQSMGPFITGSVYIDLSFSVMT